MQLQDIFTLNKVLEIPQIAFYSDLSKQIQQRLISLHFLDPPSDGIFARQSVSALTQFLSLLKLPSVLNALVAKALIETKEVIPLKLGNDLASKIIKYFIRENYYFPIGKNLYTIAYLEGCDADGKLNSNTPNLWNDRRIVVEIPDDGIPKIRGNWAATTLPGDTYTHKPLNPHGAAQIGLSQFKAWSVGTHKNHEALVQVAPISVYRDRNKDRSRNGDTVFTGIFGCNQHWGGDSPTVSAWSAGCAVGQSIAGHKEFMALCKSDRRYLVNKNYVFFTAILSGKDFVASCG